jgi:hypothetical protein
MQIKVNFACTCTCFFSKFPHVVILDDTPELVNGSLNWSFR